MFWHHRRNGLGGWDCIVHHLGLALGGRPAASFARRLMLPVSNDTLLRVVLLAVLAIHGVIVDRGAGRQKSPLDRDQSAFRFAALA
jgi:hypothetical protein